MAPRPDDEVQAILDRLADLVEHAESLTYTAQPASKKDRTMTKADPMFDGIVRGAQAYERRLLAEADAERQKAAQNETK